MAILAAGKYLFPSRTQKSSLPAPMIVPFGAKVGHCHGFSLRNFFIQAIVLLKNNAVTLPQALEFCGGLIALRVHAPRL